MITAEITTNGTAGFVDGFGLISPDEPLVLDEMKMLRVASRFRRKFGEVPLPVGVSVTVVVTD
jgi:hypothetical protein